MKSFVVFEDGHLDFAELPMPVIGDYDALVKVESCGVCNGTDGKIVHKTFKGIDTYPVVLGHEGIGRVVEIGAKVTSFAVGDLVTMPYINNLPEGYTSGWGTYSEYNVVGDAKAMEADGLIPDEYMYGQQKLPADFDPVSSAMIITFREVLSAFRVFDIQANQSLVVLGLGPVGLSFVKFAKLLGVGPIIAFDCQDGKLELAKKMGADYAFNNQTVDMVETVRSICPDGVDHALDAVGVVSFLNTGLEMIKSGGKIDVYGISAQMSCPIDWSKCPYNWTIQFNQFPSKLNEGAALGQIVNWIQTGVLDPNDFISDVFDFADIKKAFEKIENRQTDLKMVVKM